MPDQPSAYEQARDKMTKDLGVWRDRATWTAERFLAEYAEQKRREAQTNIAGILEWFASDKAIADYVHQYGTDEG